jgi:tetratricopeptide (TPR) repeat protein
MVRPRTAVALGLGVSCALILTPTPAEAACTEPSATARIVSIDNSVELKDAADTVFVPASLKAFVCQGDSVRVGGFSRATVAFLKSGLRLTIEQNTEWLVRQPRDPSRSLIELIRGAILFFTSQPGALDVQTPFVNAAVEGTEFLVRVEANRAEVAVLEGTVTLANDAGRLTLTGGQSGQAFAGMAPQRLDIRPRDAVRWALYYEPILPADSLEQLDQVPAADRNAQFYVRRASVMLGVGRIDEASADITTAKGLDPRNGEAFALDAIIAVAQNNGAAALDSGRRAVELSPQSISAGLALSYALQARFQLEAARDELLRIVPASPAEDRAEHAAVLARLAELWLSLGCLDRALSAANRAVAVAPNLARTQTVLGFAALTRLDTSAAKAAFDRAISLESKSPLARFGLGLALIRDGDLSGGRSELETAAALNVEDALIRSYLGKAYFDEKNDEQAGRQFDLAKERDPNDPTPLFYDAIRKQTVNRPVEALQDLESAISKNDNRAVYRSRFLLDSDLAVRSARLGLVYRDLGFEHLALLEGWKSLAVNPSNHSAHRLLADNYLALPRHRIARDSELLQAQLLQPINLNPVQPRLANNGLTVDDTTVSSIGFNEFTPLFARNSLRLTVDALGGQQGTKGDNLIAAGTLNRLSYSVGQFHFDSDGIRQNNDVRQNLYDAFVQGTISASTSAQIEVRGTDSELGDRRLLFFDTYLFPDQRSLVDTASVRVGGRHTFAPGSVLIGSYTRRTLDSDFNSGDGFFRERDNDRAGFGEVRYLHESRLVNLTGGTGLYRGDRTETLSIESSDLPGVRSPVRHTNAYVYGDLKAATRATVTVGVSRDDFRDGDLARTSVNPKVGVTWAASAATTIRAAAFKAFERQLISGQTIEPTNIAGFNQFFFDGNAAASWRYGVGVDRKLASAYLGVETALRDVTVPTYDISNAVVDRAFQEQLGRVYLNAVPARRLAISAEYQLDRLLGDADGNNIRLLARSVTHRAFAEGRLFLESGAFGTLRITGVTQDGRFQVLPQVVVPGADTFWTLDASIGYRLPRHRGVVAIESRNAFNANFRFQDIEPEESTIVPKRLVTVRVTLVL